MSGFAGLSEVAELLHLPVEEDAFETLNGLLVSLLDKVPHDGDTAEIHAYGYLFSVRKVEDKMIREVFIKKEANGEEKQDIPCANA